MGISVGDNVIGEPIRRVLVSIGSWLVDKGQGNLRTNLEGRIAKWKFDQGDRTHRLNYDLTEQSIVFDVGGYLGQWASDIFAIYQPWIHIFEPVKAHAAYIKKRFFRNKKIIVRNFGFYDRTTTMAITVNRDATSLFGEGSNGEVVRVVKALDYFQENGINEINLMKINIEGAEYNLLEHLINVGLINRIRNVQVQFHDFVPDAPQRMAEIQAQLRRTHHITYQYPFVWENWSIGRE